MQATMAAALRALPGEKREIALRPWLYRVAYNESVSLLRERRRCQPREELPEQVHGSVAVDVERRERLRLLVGDLNALPERQRGALVMRELSGLDYEEIGDALDCSEAAARQTVYEARVALNQQAEGRDMECEQVRRAISDGDRRRLRGRKLRAHLEACESCRDFEAAISSREQDLRALCPALPAATAAGILAGVVGVGSASAATGGLGGGAGAVGGGAVAGASGGAVGAAGAVGGAAAGAAGAAGGLAGGVVAKGAAIAAAAVIAAGAADVGGVVELPGPRIFESTDSSPTAPPRDSGTGGAAGRSGSDRAREARVNGERASSLRSGSAKGETRSLEARSEAGPQGKAKGRSRGGKPEGVGGGKPEGVGGGKPEGVGGGKPEGVGGSPPSPGSGGGGSAGGGGQPAPKPTSGRSNGSGGAKQPETAPAERVAGSPQSG